jgi:hypothetical protein
MEHGAKNMLLIQKNTVTYKIRSKLILQVHIHTWMKQHPDRPEKPEEQTVMDSVAEMHWKQHYVDQQTRNSDLSS